MINHPYFTPFVTFVLALAIGLYLQLHLHIIPDLSIKDPDSFISTNSGQEDDDSSTSASKSSSHLQNTKNNHNNDQNTGIDASGWNQWHHIRHWPDEGALWTSPRHSHAATSGIFDHEEMMFVFGGVHGNNIYEKSQNVDDDGNNNNNLPGKILGDLWRYDEFHDRWYPVVVPKHGGPGTSLQPAPRFDASLLSFDNGHKLVLTGGFNFGNDNAHSSKAVPVNNDGVWIFDISKNSWSVIPNNDDAPSSCVPTSKNTFIIGSDLYALCIDDPRVLKKFSLSTKASGWKKVHVDFAPLPSATAATKQQSSSSPSLLLTKLSETEILFFIDGKEWILDFSSSSSTEENHQPTFLRLFTIPPSPSSSASISQSNSCFRSSCITTIKHLIFVFGGITSTSSPSTMMMINDDFHVLNLETKTWKKITKGSFGRSTRPPPTFGHSCVRIRNDKIVMVGGRTSVDSPGTSDVWEFWFSETDVNGIY